MEEIGKILPRILKKQVRCKEPRVIEVLAPLWPRVAGKAIAEQSHPLAFAAGTLTLAAGCSAWAAQLRQMTEEIRAEINSFLGGPVVKKLRIRYLPGPYPPESPAPPRGLPPARDAKGQREIPKLEWLDAEAKLDPEVAELVARSFAKYFTRSPRKV